MLAYIVLFLASADSLAALADVNLNERAALDSTADLQRTTTIELSIEFPTTEVGQDWWHHVRAEFDLFIDWYNQQRVGEPAIVLDLDVWWTFMSDYYAWQTFTVVLDWVIMEAGNGHEFRTKYDPEGTVGLLLQSYPWDRVLQDPPTGFQRQALAKIRQVQQLLSS